MWWCGKNFLTVVPIPCESDRVCAIEVKLPCGDTLTVIGTCGAGSLSLFNEELNTIEAVCCSQEKKGPVLIAGDFNAHLGPLGVPRVLGSPNLPGFALKEFIDRNLLFAASCADFASGPYYTCTTQTTVDYVLVTTACSFLITSCFIHEEHPLNTSDHLPITTSLSLSVKKHMSGSSNKKPARFNWNRAIATGDVLGQVEVRIAPLLGRTYDLPDDVNDEISTVTKILVDSAIDTLPVRRDSGTKPRINDPHLKNLCIEYKKRWNIWKAAGRPNCGQLYQEKNKARNKVKHYLNHCRASFERARIQNLMQSFTHVIRPGSKNLVARKIIPRSYG